MILSCAATKHPAASPARYSSLPIPFESAVRCDLLERDLEPLTYEENRITLEVKPFEIISIRLKR